MPPPPSRPLTLHCNTQISFLCFVNPKSPLLSVDFRYPFSFSFRAMASAPTPSPNCSSVPPRPNNTHNQQQHHNKNNHKRNLSENSHSRTQQHQRQNKRWSSTRNSSKPASPEAQAEAAGAGAGSRVGAGAAGAGAGAGSGAPFAGSGSGNAPSANSSSLGTLLGPMESRLSSEFSGRRSTRYTAAKMHSGRPRISPNNHRHSEAAVEALNCLINAGNTPATIDTVLDTHVPKLWKCDDFVYLLKEFGNTGHFLQAHMCYEFAMCRENGDLAKGKLTSAMIGTLGRLGKVENAWNLFQVARHAGFGNTVYSYSAMISAFGRNGCFTHAVNLFRSMPSWGLEPNLIVYNALIDAGAKGEVDFDVVVKYFDELVAKGLVPDRVTYNSLLCTCVPKGLWELAQSLLREMDETGVGRDLYSYNTYLDTLCKAGKMDLAKEVLEEMPRKKVWPSVVTYSTMMDGYAKANRLEDALNLYDEMNRRNVGFDRVSYNTLIGIYAKLGWFEEAIYKCREMERRGIRMDVVTYNALLGGYGKQGKYDEVRRMFEEMKARNVYPNVLTYSTMIDVFTKSGRYREAMDVYREFKQEGLEVDVVFYSALIDALCKNGLVESSMMLLDAMIAEGIKPNVVTYNSIIDAFGQLSALECAVDTSLQANEYPTEHSSSMVIAGTNQVTDKEGGDRIMKMFEQLVAAEKSGHMKNTKRCSQDQLGILWIFRKMHEMDIKPNVVTFSAILNACSRCHSFEGASRLLDELRVFDNQAYGVAHRLLIGYRDQIWFRALSLFDEVKRMDSSTASAFYNALTDMLWHFGQKLGAQMVVLEGRRRNVWKGDWSDSCLDLHLMSCGAACAMVHAWLLYIRSTVFEGCELPRIVNILTGWGKHSKVVGDGTLKRAIEALLNGMGSPFRIVESNLGRFTSPGDLVAAWLRQPSTWNVLVLHDLICHSKPPGPSRDYPALCL